MNKFPRVILMKFRITRRDCLRPMFGFVVVQPALMLFFFLNSTSWWTDYLEIGWPINIVMTFWLIPCYAFYEWLWDKSKTEPSYSPTDT